MRNVQWFFVFILGALALAGCGSDSSTTGGGGSVFACNDGADNDADGLTDFPDDPGCLSAQDNDETDPTLGGTPTACNDGVDNDNDGLTDYPDDPGCLSASDNDETDPGSGGGTAPACSDGADNDGDGLTDFPNDPGCDSAQDGDETDPAGTMPACSDGADNDADGLTDFPADPGCQSAQDNDETDPVASNARTRYAMHNQCWAIRANGNDAYIERVDGAYTATATRIGDAEPFFFKPSALGKYLLYSSERELLAVDGGDITTQASGAATDNAEWTVTGVGDDTAYPETPAYHVEPTPEQVEQWHGFDDPMLRFVSFTLFSAAADGNLIIDGSGDLFAVPAGTSPTLESFSFERIPGCAEYPEARSDVGGLPYSGTTADGRVLGHADVHVHISATEFLGGAEWGRPYHKFGVEHALGDCSVEHGTFGEQDFVGAAFSGDPDGHATDGYPTFSEWPDRDSLTHEAIYWKWLERSWASGLRVVVNDLVDNRTLCELYREARGNPNEDCNSMNNAGRQAGTMYGMQDYIDAQYGGPGEGFFQIVHTPEEAREVIADGKMAVVLGIEISNLFDCQLTYNPFRMQEPHEEQGSGPTDGENHYNCTMEGPDEDGNLPENSILHQMQRVHDWGVRQIISIHEFDNAFGGNGIFDGMILNMGNRENSGGLLSGDLDLLTNGEVAEFFANSPMQETPTGEFWTTFDCPIEGGDNATPGFSGYFWGNSGGSTQNFLQQPACIPTGQGGRSGGTTACYPAASQCNARWMTPIGRYMFTQLMEMGFIIDFDHLAVGMKTQLLELAEAQDPVYPLVSTHGKFGGITNDQARRVLAGGGYLYPSNGSSAGFINDMNETLAIYQQAMDGVPVAERPLFGFGYGTDTNGLSSQTRPRDNPENPITYPFQFFAGSIFNELDVFDDIAAVSFGQPSSRDETGTEIRTWHEDIHGNAHHGMLADFIQEIRLDGTTEHMRHLFNSAEVYLQTWERTQAASAAVRANGVVLPDGMLRPAPVGTPESDPFASPAAE